MIKSIVKWAIYTDGDCLLRPHYSWDFSMVDCTEYKTKKQIKSYWYSPDIVKRFLDGVCLEYEGEKYYECEFSPYHTENMELLSNLPEFEYYDDNTEF